MKKLLIALVVGIMMGSFVAFARVPMDTYVFNLPKQSLSTAEIQGMLHMREEEKLARDVYITLYNKWKLPIFKNISKSETWHMHMVKLLLDKYNIPDPVEKTGNVVGVFENEDIQNLYNQLVDKGLLSLEDALTVGATIEDLDIKDLEDAIDRSDNEDIDLVYENLMKGSRNHMRAFVGMLRNNGWDYTPQYISQDYFDQIVNSPKETGMETIPYCSSIEISGTVEKVYLVPTPRRGVYWWMVELQADNGTTLRVAVAPTTMFMKNFNVKIGDVVDVKGYQGTEKFISCEFQDNSTGFAFNSSNAGNAGSNSSNVGNGYGNR